jgi:hypothetical protein
MFLTLNENQIVYIVIAFILYNFMICGGVWCYGKMCGDTMEEYRGLKLSFRQKQMLRKMPRHRRKQFIQYLKKRRSRSPRRRSPKVYVPPAGIALNTPNGGTIYGSPTSIWVHPRKHNSKKAYVYATNAGRNVFACKSSDNKRVGSIIDGSNVCKENMTQKVIPKFYIAQKW